mmetsp:Transcript_103902/g.294059  ORF Transcript_103902/g.294059 Transcript_103902/m.294059 type:complete len:443 (+) Transcript_103902:4314-5642(+)
MSDGQGVRDGGHRLHGRVRNVPDEVPEQECGVSRAPARLRVELYRKPWAKGVDDALVRAVVCVDHQRHPAVCQRRVVDGKAVVLRSDVAARGAHVHAGLVHAAVPELHLVRRGPRRQPKDLVPQADAEDGQGRAPQHHLAHVPDGLLALQGVAGPVAQEEAVELVLREVVVPRHHREVDPKLDGQVSDDVVLHPAVHCHYLGHRLGGLPNCLLWRRGRRGQRRRQEHLGLPARDGGGQVGLVRVREPGGPRRLAAVHDHLAQDGAVHPNQLRQGPRVHAIDARDLLLLQPLPKRPLGGVVRPSEGVVGDDHRLDVDPLALEVREEPEGVALLVWHAVVPDQGEREHQDLSGVGRVRQRLGVPDHAGVEHDLARRRALVAEGEALEGGAIGQLQPRPAPGEEPGDEVRAAGRRAGRVLRGHPGGEPSSRAQPGGQTTRGAEAA